MIKVGDKIRWTPQSMEGAPSPVLTVEAVGDEFVTVRDADGNQGTLRISGIEKHVNAGRWSKTSA